MEERFSSQDGKGNLSSKCEIYDTTSALTLVISRASKINDIMTSCSNRNRSVVRGWCIQDWPRRLKGLYHSILQRTVLILNETIISRSVVTIIKSSKRTKNLQLNNNLINKLIFHGFKEKSVQMRFRRIPSINAIAISILSIQSRFAENSKRKVLHIVYCCKSGKIMWKPRSWHSSNTRDRYNEFFNLAEAAE